MGSVSQRFENTSVSDRQNQWFHTLVSHVVSYILFHIFGPLPYEFIGFGDLHGPKPYEFIWFGDLHGPKPYEFIGFGDPPPFRGWGAAAHTTPFRPAGAGRLGGGGGGRGGAGGRQPDVV